MQRARGATRRKTREVEETLRRKMFPDAGHGYDLFGLHPPTLARAVALSAPLYRRYFRVESSRIDCIPREGPAILVANHSGVLPIDAVLLCIDVLLKSERVPRVAVDRFVPSLPFVGTFYSRLGAVSGTRLNVRRLLEDGALVVILPEGVSGVSKRYRERYVLQDWHVGHAELAIRHQVPVVPAGIIGAEEAWPILGRIPGFHAFGAPYLPIPRTPLPLPARISIYYGAPLHLGRGASPGAADDPRVVADAAGRVRDAVEVLLAEGLAARKRVFR